MITSILASCLYFGTSMGLSGFSRSSHTVLRSRRSFCFPIARQKSEQLLVVVGGGAAGVYASVIVKELASHLDVLIIEKGKPLSKVKISGGGRCNVTNGHFMDKMALAENYPRGNKELRGTFFDIHGPKETMQWFSEHGVELKTEQDGRVFPVSNHSSSVVDCLLCEAKRREVCLQTGKVVSDASSTDEGKFLLTTQKHSLNLKEYIVADYLLVATGSSPQGYKIAAQLGHSLIDPMPSLFTFKIEDADAHLTNLSGVTFRKVKAKLKLDNAQRNIPQFNQEGPMLVTHWGLSGPVILRLSAWGARDLFLSNYKGILIVDFVPDIHIEDVKRMLFKHKDQFGAIDGDILWASISNNSINSLTLLLKQFKFKIVGKGPFKEEFVTAGGIPLSEVSLNTMESKIRPKLFFAGEVLNVDGVTGGFNFQNAWTGGYIAGMRIAELASGCDIGKLL